MLALAVSAGVAVRLALWWQDRAFWRDELALVQSLDAYPTGRLLGPLADAQSAPPLWLLLVRAVSLVAGDGERAYRLVSLGCGCATLVAMALVSARMMRHRWAAVVPLVLVATISDLVFYTAQTKPYTTDTLAVTWLLLLSILLLRGDRGGRAGGGGREGGRRVELAWYASLMLLPWLSYGAMLTAPFAAGWVAVVQLRRGTHTVGWLASRLTGPAVSVAGAALLAHSVTSQVDDFTAYWAAFLGPVGRAGGWWSWTGFVARDLALHELGFPLWWAALLLVVAGLVVAVRRQPATGVVLALPVVATYTAGVLGVYPFGRRLAEYCVPGMLVYLGVLVDAGAGWLGSRVARVGAHRPSDPRTSGFVVLVGVAASALVLTVGWTRPLRLAHDLHYLYGVDDYRGALAYVAANWRAGDVLVVGQGDRVAVRVYAPRLHLDLRRAYQAVPSLDTTARRRCALPAELSTARRTWVVTDDVVPLYPGRASRSAIVAPLLPEFRPLWHRDRGLVTVQLLERGQTPNAPAARCLGYASVGRAGDPKVPPTLLVRHSRS